MKIAPPLPHEAKRNFGREPAFLNERQRSTSSRRHHPMPPPATRRRTWHDSSPQVVPVAENGRAKESRLAGCDGRGKRVPGWLGIRPGQPSAGPPEGALARLPRRGWCSAPGCSPWHRARRLPGPGSQHPSREDSPQPPTPRGLHPYPHRPRRHRLRHQQRDPLRRRTLAEPRLGCLSSGEPNPRVNSRQPSPPSHPVSGHHALARHGSRR